MAPGNRAVPLIASLSAMAQQDKKIIIETSLDERSLAFEALGASKVGKKIVLICTSGSALSHFYPALMEAQSEDLDFVIISADRPLKDAHLNVDQSVHQLHFYADYVDSFISLETPKNRRDFFFMASRLNVTRGKRIHFNVSIEGPLHLAKGFFLEEKELAFMEKELREYYLEDFDFSLNDFLLKKKKNVLFFFGKNCESIEEENILFLERLKDKFSQQFYLYADITSNLRQRKGLSSILEKDLMGTLNDNNIDLVVHFYSRAISRSYYDYFSTEKGMKTSLVSVSPAYLFHDDPSCRIRKKYNEKMNFFLKRHLPLFDLRENKKRINSTNENMEKRTLGETLGFSIRRIKKKNFFLDVFLGNGLTIRDFNDSFFEEGSVEFFYNRGVNGIDGNLSTILGIASIRKNKMVAFLGDLTFLHDSSVLKKIKEKEKKLDLLIVIVNDFGGNIFKKLPTAKIANFESALLIGHHKTDISSIGEGFGIKSKQIFSNDELEETLRQFLEKKETSVNLVELIQEQRPALFP